MTRRWRSGSRGPCRGAMTCLNGRAASYLVRCDRRRRIVLRPAIAYYFGFSGELRTRFTTDRDIRKVRAMSAALTPALKRRANQICCSFGDLLNPSELVIADGRRLAF